MKTVWTAGMTLDEAAEFKNYLKSQKKLLERLRQILAARLEGIDRKGLFEEDYKTTDWVPLMAFRNGRIAEIKELDDLLAI